MTHVNPNVKIDDDGTTYYRCALLSIDAWKEEGGWQWNDIFIAERDIWIAEDSKVLSSPRMAAKYFRDSLGALNEHSKGRVRMDMGNDIMDGVLIVVESKNTGEPVFALSSMHC